MTCSLRGSVCVYQGEELGLTEVELSYEQLRDPYGIAFWPDFKGRDGCRTPMPWTDDEHGGFSPSEPWLPVPDGHRQLSVERQLAEADSSLQRVRRFLRWRKQHPALLLGAIEMLAAPEPVLAFERRHQGEVIRAYFNTSGEACRLLIPEARSWQALSGHGLVEGELRGDDLHLPSYGVLFATPVES